MTHYIVLQGRPAEVRRALREYLPRAAVRALKSARLLVFALPGRTVEVAMLGTVAVIRVEE